MTNHIIAICKKITEANQDGWREAKDKKVRTRIEAGDLVKILVDKQTNIPLEFNTLTQQVQYRCGWPISAKDMEAAYIHFSMIGFSISKSETKDAIVTAARMKRSYCPVAEYLNDLEYQNNAHILPIIDFDNLATTYLNNNNLLANKMLKKFLIGCVKRGLNAGTKLDYVCVLKGAQGIKKSTFWRLLAEGKSPQRGFFCDTPSSHLDKDSMMIFGCNWIYEFQELDSVTTHKQTNKLKALITGTHDTFRVPYGSSIDVHPRKACLVGTVNTDDFLRDKTGNRRFWVIETDKIDTEKLLRDRDAIWYAAFSAYKRGELCVLSEAEEELLAVNNINYEPDCPFEVAFGAYLDPNNISRSLNLHNGFTIDDIIIACGLRNEGNVDNASRRAGNQAMNQFPDFEKVNTTRGQLKRARVWRLKAQKDGLDTKNNLLQFTQKDNDIN